MTLCANHTVNNDVENRCIEEDILVHKNNIIFMPVDCQLF